MVNCDFCGTEIYIEFSYHTNNGYLCQNCYIKELNLIGDFK